MIWTIFKGESEEGKVLYKIEAYLCYNLTSTNYAFNQIYFINNNNYIIDLLQATYKPQTGVAATNNMVTAQNKQIC